MIRMGERYIGDDGTLTRQGYAAFTPLEKSRVQVQTAVASAAQTSILFQDIPAWVNRITMTLAGFSTSGTNNYLLQIGAGSFPSSGYLGTRSTIDGATASSGSPTASVVIANAPLAASVYRGLWVIQRHSGNTWIVSGQGSFSNTATMHFAAAETTLSGALDRVRVTTTGSTDTIDAGSVNIAWE
jgi:hypothetical protein